MYFFVCLPTRAILTFSNPKNAQRFVGAHIHRKRKVKVQINLLLTNVLILILTNGFIAKWIRSVLHTCTHSPSPDAHAHTHTHIHTYIQFSFTFESDSFNFMKNDSKLIAIYLKLESITHFEILLSWVNMTMLPRLCHCFVRTIDCAM